LTCSTNHPGRPFDFEGVTRQFCEIELAHAGERDDAFPCSLSDLAQRPQRTDEGGRTKFLSELTPCSLVWILVWINFAP
jgi:hypothetical protein